MNAQSKLKKFLPLSEATFYIMLVLDKPLHGYGVMREVEKVTKGAVSIGPGTLYGAFGTLEKEKLIVLVEEIDRRKVYQLTDQGRRVLEMQMDRLNLMHSIGKKYNKKYVEVSKE